MMKLVRCVWTFVGMVVLLTYVSWAGWFSDVQKGLETARKENKAVVFTSTATTAPTVSRLKSLF